MKRRIFDPKPQQGACLAQEVGEVGGETSGPARGRAVSPPTKLSRPRSGPYSLKRGCGGSSPCVCVSLFRNRTGQQISRTAIANRLSVFWLRPTAALGNLRNLWFQLFER